MAQQYTPQSGVVTKYTTYPDLGHTLEADANGTRQAMKTRFGQASEIFASMTRVWRSSALSFKKLKMRIPCTAKLLYSLETQYINIYAPFGYPLEVENTYIPRTVPVLYEYLYLYIHICTVIYIPVHLYAYKSICTVWYDIGTMHSTGTYTY